MLASAGDCPLGAAALPFLPFGIAMNAIASATIDMEGSPEPRTMADDEELSLDLPTVFAGIPSRAEGRCSCLERRSDSVDSSTTNLWSSRAPSSRRADLVDSSPCSSVSSACGLRPECGSEPPLMASNCRWGTPFIRNAPYPVPATVPNES